MRSRRPLGSPGGTTLIELLMAVGIAVLLVALSVSVYLTVVSSCRVQISRRERMTPAVAALTRLSRDVSCAVLPFRQTRDGFALQAGDAPQYFFSNLTFFTARAGVCPADMRRYTIDSVQYTLQVSTSAPPFELIRYSRSLVNADASVPREAETLARGVSWMTFAVFDGNEWTPEWRTANTVGLPKAARVVLAVRVEQTSAVYETEILIPAGHSIRSGGLDSGKRSDPARR